MAHVWIKSFFVDSNQDSKYPRHTSTINLTLTMRRKLKILKEDSWDEASMFAKHVCSMNDLGYFTVRLKVGCMMIGHDNVKVSIFILL